jgi:hypothetical protein
MKQSSAVALLVLALAACKPASEANNAASTEPNAAAPTDIEALPPSEDVVPPVTEDGASNEAATANTIPAAFQGRWGMVPADCTSTRGDNKGLITVDSNSIKFYESRATLAKVTMDAPENFTGDFTFTGEGQTWTKSDNLKLTGSSNTLIRTETDPPVKLTYTRCPA